MKALRALLPVCLVAASLAGARAQESDSSPPPPNGYVPQTYKPLYAPATGGPAEVPPDPEDVIAVPQKPASDAADQPLPSFRPPAAAPRLDSGGFAPLVNAPAPTDRTLVNAEQGLPRMYAPGFRLGAFDVRPDMAVLGTYNDNIYLSPKGKPRQGDYIVSVIPQVALTYENGSPGDVDTTQFAFSYSPIFLQFAQISGNSTFNQNLTASFGHRFTKLSVFAGQSYAHTSGGLIEAGDLVGHDAANSFVDFAYVLSPKTGLELSTAYALDDFSSGFGSDEFSSLLYLNYAIRPKLTVSIAPYVGYLTSQGTSNDQLSFGGVLRANYTYSDQTSFYAQIGGGERQYSLSSMTTAEWNGTLGAHWQVAAKTAFELTAARKTKSAVTTANSDYNDTSVGGTVQQLLVDKLTMTLSANYDHADYFSTFNGAQQQVYDFFSVGPSLTYHPSVWSDVGLSYAYRQNFSNVPNSEFNNNQITVFSTVRF